MSGSCIAKLPHKCGSSDALQVFDKDGKITGYCFSCGKYEPNPYGNNPIPAHRPKLVKTYEQEQQEIEEVSALRTFSLPHRKLEDWALEYFGVKVAVSEQDGQTPTVTFFPYYNGGELLHYKAKIIENKSFFRAGHKGEIDPFGWRQALESHGSRLYITEGEEDAIALYQALKIRNKNKPEYAAHNPAVISIANGSSAAKKDINRVANTIKNIFKDVVLVLDQDEQGKKAAESIIQILPNAKTVVLPCKDANACVMEGRSNALCDAVLFKSEKPKNTRIINASSLFKQAREPAEWGLSWPWTGLTDLTRGIRFGEVHYFGAGVKMGKSELVNAIGKHLIIDHNLPVLMAKPEEANKKSVKLLLGKVAGKIFHDPKIAFDYEAYDEAAEKVGDKLRLLDIYQHLGWETLRDDIIAAAHDGSRAIFIDPITNLVNGKSAADTDVILKEISQDSAAIAKDLNLAIFFFCHLKAPDSGPDHEHGGKVYSSQFAGSRGMMRSCHYMYGLEGDKSPEDAEGNIRPLEEKNMRRLILLEDREFGNTGIVNLWWNHNNGIFSEVEV